MYVAINSDVRLHEGRGPFYNAQNITITLHGTGLFHFKAGLGKFDSFGEVTGYFTVLVFLIIFENWADFF